MDGPGMPMVACIPTRVVLKTFSKMWNNSASFGTSVETMDDGARTVKKESWVNIFNDKCCTHILLLSWHLSVLKYNMNVDEYSEYSRLWYSWLAFCFHIFIQKLQWCHHHCLVIFLVALCAEALWNGSMYTYIKQIGVPASYLLSC